MLPLTLCFVTSSHSVTKKNKLPTKEQTEMPALGIIAVCWPWEGRHALETNILRIVKEDPTLSKLVFTREQLSLLCLLFFLNTHWLIFILYRVLKPSRRTMLGLFTRCTLDGRVPTVM